MSLQRKRRAQLPPRQPTRPDLSPVVALLNDKDFIKDSQQFWAHYRAQAEKIGANEKEWDRQAPEFMAQFLDPFTAKWSGAYPANDELLSSPLWQEKNSSIMSARWGVIPVFPWTTEAEVTDQLKQIKRKIGNRHRDHLKAIRLAQIARWLRTFFISTRTGKPPTLKEIATAVWGRTKGLTRLSKKAAISKLPESREMELFRQLTQEGKSRAEAQRLVYRRARGSEAPAIAMVRMALTRLTERKVRDTEMLASQRANPLGLAITRLLHELPTSQLSTPDLNAIRSRAVDLGNLLLPPEPLGQLANPK